MKTEMSHLMAKPTNWHVHPAKTQISLGIRPVWSVFAVHMEKAWVLMPRLIRVFVGRTYHFAGFLMRRLKYLLNIILRWQNQKHKHWGGTNSAEPIVCVFITCKLADISLIYIPYAFSIWCSLNRPMSDIHKWASSWENLFLPYANNKGADQPVHPRSLISAFVVCCLDSITPILVKSRISS